MNIEIFTVCDFACDYGQSKLNIIGTFDHVNAPVYPFQMPQFAIATRLRIGNHEAGKHKMLIKIIDADGKMVNQVDGNLDVRKHPTEDYSVINIAMNVGNMKFPKPGKYAVEFYWDEEFQSGLTIHARQVQPMQRAA